MKEGKKKTTLHVHVHLQKNTQQMWGSLLAFFHFVRCFCTFFRSIPTWNDVFLRNFLNLVVWGCDDPTSLLATQGCMCGDFDPHRRVLSFIHVCLTAWMMGQIANLLVALLSLVLFWVWGSTIHLQCMHLLLKGVCGHLHPHKGVSALPKICIITLLATAYSKCVCVLCSCLQLL